MADLLIHEGKHAAAFYSERRLWQSSNDSLLGPRLSACP